MTLSIAEWDRLDIRQLTARVRLLTDEQLASTMRESSGETLGARVWQALLDERLRRKPPQDDVSAGTAAPTEIIPRLLAGGFATWSSIAAIQSLVTARDGTSLWAKVAFSLPSAAIAAVCWLYAWQGNSLRFSAILRYAKRPAILTGGIAFVAGFIGPLLLYPESAQGPLLSAFLALPGVAVGAIGGMLFGLVRTSADEWE